MPTSLHIRKFIPTDFASVATVLFLMALWLAGGASRGDVPGQALVRAAAVLALLWAAILGPRLSVRAVRSVVILLGLAILLPLLQLVVLPPAWWQVLPGRAVFVQAAQLSGQPQPWRPLSIVPWTTVNAAASLIVPTAMLTLLLGLYDRGRQWLPATILSFIAASTLLGMLQFAGAGFNNPFVNDTPGQVSGSFANRNHLALFMAIGCLVAPCWAFVGRRHAEWRAPVALGLVILFLLMIVATGSRAGLGLGIVAVAMGLVLIHKNIRSELRRWPRWVFPAVIFTVILVIAAAVLLTVAANRAVAIDRALSVDLGQDMRARGLPTVLTMIWTYFPVGAGLGGFDPIFRLNEPFSLLKATYFNHAHDDWLEVVLDAGVPGLLLLLGAVIWWFWATIAAWRDTTAEHRHLARLGSTILLLIMIASIFDYPARTPMFMALIVLASVWLSDRGVPRDPAGAALRHAEHLL